MSEFTSGLRKKLDSTTDFSTEYQKIFGDFADKKLAKDDLYYSIKNEIEAKTRVAGKKKKKDSHQATILPKIKTGME